MLNIGSKVAGCIVDEVTDIVKYDDAEMQSAPILANSSHMNYLKGIAKVDDRMIIILDPKHLVASDDILDMKLALNV